jgi:hypothetical protein
MTFKVTIWNKKETIGLVRDYRKPAWNGDIHRTCHGMGKLPDKTRPWVIELEGEVPGEVVYNWAFQAMHPHSHHAENLIINGAPFWEWADAKAGS